jgi:hypothetical protein
MKLRVSGQEGVKGEIERTPDDRLLGSNKAMQRLADQALGNARGNVAEAWDHLLSINNGYAWTDPI